MSVPTIRALVAGDIANLPPLDIAAIDFLAGYTGRTRQTYGEDLKAYLDWCTTNRLDPLAAQRFHLELYLRWMHEIRGLAPATCARRFTTVAMFYRGLYRDERIPKDPCQWVRRPQVDRAAQRRTYLTALEFAALLQAAKELGPTEHAAISLLGILGLRVNEMCTADVEDLGGQSGFDYLRILGKGGKVAEMGLPNQVMFAVRAAVADRTRGPLLLNRWGNRLDRKACQRIIDSCRAHTVITIRRVTPHGLRRTCAGVLFDAGADLRAVQQQLRHVDPKTTTQSYDVRRRNHAGQASHTLAAFLGNLGE